MNTNLAIGFVWTTSAALVVKLLSAWDRLPARVAVHFGTNMRPNRWSSKNALAAFILVAVLGQATLVTFLLPRIGGASVGITLVLGMINVALVSAFWQVIRYNAEGAAVQPVWMFLSLAAVFVFITVFMGKLVLGYYGR